MPTTDNNDTKLIDLFSQLMASGAAYFAENLSSFRGSKANLSSHFYGMAADFIKYRPGFTDELREALGPEVTR